MFTSYLSGKAFTSRVYQQFKQFYKKSQLRDGQSISTDNVQRSTNGQQMHEKRSASLIIKDMQVESTLKFVNPVRRAVIQKIESHEYW